MAERNRNPQNENPHATRKTFARSALLISMLCLGGTAYAAGCASTPDDSSTPTLAVSTPPGALPGADPAIYRTSVNAVFERRCGTLECHGQIGRGLRIYGTYGLRIPNDAGLVPGTGTTTQEEINANYASIVGLQPEKFNEFLAKSPRTQEDAYQLIVLTKPLDVERHKGGPALNKGEPAEQCIVKWLVGGKFDENLCVLGSKAP